MSEKEFGVKKVNGGQNICNRDASVGEGRILKNKLGPLRVKRLTSDCLMHTKGIRY